MSIAVSSALSGANPFAELVCPTVLGIKPYVPGKPIEELRREKGLQRVVKLASNENPLGPPPGAIAALAACGPSLHRYPDGFGFELKTALARHWDVSVENLVLGNGSSEILGNPNNPTGSAFRRGPWEAFLAALPRRVGLVLDEAYAEYAEDPDFPVGREYLDEARPLVVVRTFSKAYGLAALRIGYGLAPRGLVDYMNRLRLPFNANRAAQAAALAALADTEHVARSRELNHQGMEKLYRYCAERGLEWVPSQANFLLIRVPRAGEVAEALLDHGVIVRWAASFGMPEWLRVTVGTTEELACFEGALSRVLAA
jgi:histidinol-phosphate aminotransferase